MNKKKLLTIRNSTNKHLKNIFESSKLDKAATIRKFRIVQKEGSRQVEREHELQANSVVKKSLTTASDVNHRGW